MACLKIHPLIIIGLTLDWRHLSCASCARDTSVVSYLELVPLSIRGIKHGLTVDWQWNDHGLALWQGVGWIGLAVALWNVRNHPPLRHFGRSI